MYLYPLVVNIEKLQSLFLTISALEIPTKFTYRYLASIGYPSSNDRDLLTLLKTFGLIDVSGKPTPSYSFIKNKDALVSYMREQLSVIYKDLFLLDTKLPNVAQTKINEYFGTLTGLSLQDCSALTKTFLELCSFSDFVRIVPVPQESTRRLTPNINLSLKIPATTDERVYESLFRHLKDLINP